MKKNYKILMVAPQFYPRNGGYANAITNFTYLLAYNGNVVHVVTFEPLNNAKKIHDKNIEIYRLKRRTIIKGLNLFLNEYRIAAFIHNLDKENNYDFILFETVEYPFAIWCTLNLFKKIFKTGVRIHAAATTEGTVFRKGLYYKIRYFLIKNALRKIYFILSTSNYYLNFVNKYYLNGNDYLIGEKFEEIIPNVIYKEQRKDLIEEDFNIINLKKDKITFLSLGRMDYFGVIEKGFQDILVALSYLKDKNYFNDLKLIIIGDGNCRNKLIKFSQELGLKKQIKFIKYLPNNEVQYLQSKVSAVILASRFEGCSMFALESLKNGAPLIFSNTGGIKDMVKHKFNGLLFKPQDPIDLSKKIDNFITFLFPNIENFRCNSFKLYKRKFAPQATYEKFKTFLDSIVSSRQFID